MLRILSPTDRSRLSQLAEGAQQWQGRRMADERQEDREMVQEDEGDTEKEQSKVFRKRRPLRLRIRMVAADRSSHTNTLETSEAVLEIATLPASFSPPAAKEKAETLVPSVLRIGPPCAASFVHTPSVTLCTTAWRASLISPPTTPNPL